MSRLNEKQSNSPQIEIHETAILYLSRESFETISDAGLFYVQTDMLNYARWWVGIIDVHSEEYELYRDKDFEIKEISGGFMKFLDEFFDKHPIDLQIWAGE